MGSLMLAAAGAVGGLGQGITEVGQQEQKAQLLQKQNDLIQAREETLQRLRAAEEEKLQASGQQFQHTETETAAGRNVAAAGAQRQFLTEQEKSREAAAGARTNAIVGGRVRVANINADSREANATLRNEKPPKADWKSSTVQLPGLVPARAQRMITETDPRTGQRTSVPDPSDKPPMIPGKVPYRIMNHISGATSIVKLADGRFVPFDGQHIPDTKSVGRPPARDVQDLLQNPDRYPQFLQRYHQLPEGFDEAYTAHFQNLTNDYNSRHSGGANTSSAPSSNQSSGQDDDQNGAQEDLNLANGNDPYGTKGNTPSTTAEDYAPAQ
jgi:hypothetical protein